MNAHSAEVIGDRVVIFRPRCLGPIEITLTFAEVIAAAEVLRKHVEACMPPDLTRTELALQRESWARGEAAMGSDVDEARERAAARTPARVEADLFFRLNAAREVIADDGDTIQFQLEYDSPAYRAFRRLRAALMAESEECTCGLHDCPHVRGRAP